MEKRVPYKIQKQTPGAKPFPISISVTKEQLDYLDKLAERAYLTRSAFIRIKLGLEEVPAAIKELVENAYE